MATLRELSLAEIAIIKARILAVTNMQRSLPISVSTRDASRT